MKMNKRLLSLVLALVMLLGMIPLNAIATDETDPVTPTHIEGCGEECAVEGCTCTCHAPAHIDTCLEGCAVEGCACLCHQPATMAEVPCEECDGTYAEDGVTVLHESDCPSLCTCEPVDDIHVGDCIFASEVEEPVCNGKADCPVEDCENDHCTGDENCPIENCACKAPLCDKCEATKAEDGVTIVHEENCLSKCKCEAVIEGYHSNMECPYYVKPVADPVCTGDPATCTIENCECKQPAAPEKTLAEKLLEIDNLSDLLIGALEDEMALMELTLEEINALRAHAEALYAAIENPSEQDGWDLDDFLATTEMLPNYRAENACPDCGLIGEHAEDCPWVQMAVMPNMSGTIGATTISQNTTWTLTGNVTLNGTITISSGTLTIKANGSTETITRGSTFTGTLFKINRDAKLIITNTNGAITIDGNCENVDLTVDRILGYAIDCQGNMELTGVTVKDNWRKWQGYTADELRSRYNGGGICIQGNGYTNTVKITDCLIKNCRAGQGGGICLFGGGQHNVTIERTVVEDCYGVGGGVRSNGAGMYKLTMKDCVIRNNYSPEVGGGMYWNCVTGTGDTANSLVVEDCQFINNRAGTYGGGMHLEGNNITIKATTGTSSAAVTTGGVPSAGLTGTLVSGNSAVTYGGGIGIRSYNNVDEQHLQFTEAVMNFNENVIVDNNTAPTGAGIAIQLNSSYNCTDDAIYTYNFNGPTVTNNTATGNGGGISIKKNFETYRVNVYWNSGTLANNHAKNGGGIAITPGSGITSGGNLYVAGGTISNNTASQNGGAAYVSGGSFTLSGGTISSNVATGNGGAAYVSGGSFTMTNGTVTGNNAVDGGAIYVDGTGGFTMSNGIISNNTATGNGGAAYVKGGNAMIHHGKLDENKAVKGGAVYMSGGASTTLTMQSGTMNENEATDDGGAIYATSGILHIGLEDCKTEQPNASCNHHTDLGTGRHHPKINQNKAGDTGGGISIADEGSVYFYCGEAKENEALYKGVGMNVFMNGGDFYLHDGADIGLARDPDLVIVGGELHNECADRDYINLYYYMSNNSGEEAMHGLAEFDEVMNLPDGEYFWDAPEGYVFLGWTAQGSADETYVRNKEQYIDSGEPVQILDKMPSKPDTFADKQDEETYNNTVKMFDGTEDKAIHLYALWAPVTSDIIYVDGMTGQNLTNTASDPDNPATYTFSRESNIIDINPVLKPGYDLVGWYIYQNAEQNANWNDTQVDYEAKKYEPISSGDYKEHKTYLEVTRNGVLSLEAGNTNFGDITLIAHYVPAFTTLIIDKNYPAGADYDVDENQSFVFTVYGQPNDTKTYPNPITITVVVQADGQATVEHLPVGTYTVTEISDWSWRYNPEDASIQVEALDAAEDYEVDFTNSRSKSKWLDGDSICVNWFNGSKFVAK